MILEMAQCLSTFTTFWKSIGEEHVPDSVMRL